ncbi:hypothetical protein D3C80_1313180 [compost metagenome]
MRTTIIFLALILFSACSRDIRFVRVNEPLPVKSSVQTVSTRTDNHIEELISDKTVESQAPDGGTKECEPQLMKEEISKKNKVAKSQIQNESTQGSLTHILSANKDYQKLTTKQQQKLVKRLSSISERYKGTPAPPPQQGKTFAGASIMIVGAFFLVAGIFSVFGSPAGLWAILLGAALVILGGALLVSGSMSSKREKK